MLTPRFLNLGDTALTIEFGNKIDKELVSMVAAMDVCLKEAVANGRLNGVVETMPTYRSLTVIFDPQIIRKAVLQKEISELLNSFDMTISNDPRRWSLPVLYGGDYGPDVEVVAEAKGITPDQVIDFHSSQTYIVYMVGFLPGFPFMGDVLPEIHMPRRREPRVIVPAGSVAITGQQTAVYPWESPGGWQLIGRCPLDLFNSKSSSPTLLSAGDEVVFEKVSQAEYENLVEQKKSGSLDYNQFSVNRGDL